MNPLTRSEASQPRTLNYQAQANGIAIQALGTANWAKINYNFDTSHFGRLEIYRNKRGFPSQHEDHIREVVGKCVVNDFGPGQTIESAKPDQIYYYSCYAFPHQDFFDKMLSGLFHCDAVATLHFKLIFPSLESLEEPKPSVPTLDQIDEAASQLLFLHARRREKLTAIDRDPSLAGDDHAQEREELKELVNALYEEHIDQLTSSPENYSPHHRLS